MSEQLILGTRKGVIMLDRRSGSWKPRPVSHPGVPVCYACADPRDGTLWAALDHGHWGSKLSRSTDGGRTWADSGQVKYPAGARYVEGWVPAPEGEATPDDTPKAPNYKDAKLLKLWVIGFGGAEQPGRVYVGTIPGGLFVSDDDGDSFELNRPLWNHESRGGDLFNGETDGSRYWFGTPASMESGEFAAGIHSIVVDPRDSRRMLVAVSCAGVIETTDGGQTWHGRNKGMTNDYLPDPEAEWGHDPHFITLCRGQPDHVWQQNHVGVFYSSDGARQWQKVSSADHGVNFGFPIAADENDGRTAWVVPAKSDQERMAIDGGLFVGRTQDGGESWEQLREGLPQENTHDTVYRHALDASGRYLAFGSTTGNLYISEDGGESWHCAGNNYPPIYSVRFVSDGRA